MKFKNPRLEFKGSLEDYLLENYPDYLPGKPPQTEAIAELDYLEEAERRMAGTNGIRCVTMALARDEGSGLEEIGK